MRAKFGFIEPKTHKNIQKHYVSNTGLVTATDKEGTATITATIAGTPLVASTEVTVSSKPVQEYVDLDLPSRTLWATCNIGAENPWEYGDYFAWGETKGYNSSKTTFDWSTYTLCNGSNSTMKKYCTRSYYGTVDNKTELDSEDDAAVNSGIEWRMPTYDQLQELLNSRYTTTKWITLNGVRGRKISKNDDSSVYIFLPAAGYRDGSSLYDAVSGGYYWSRSLNTDYSYSAYCLDFISSNIYTATRLRYYGFSVRPVRAK